MRAQKKERREMEAARRASQLAAGASSSRTVQIAGSTTYSAVVAEDTTEVVQIADDVGAGEPDPPGC